MSSTVAYSKRFGYVVGLEERTDCALEGQGGIRCAPLANET